MKRKTSTGEVEVVATLAGTTVIELISGAAFADLVAEYILVNFEDRKIKVYREVKVGKTIIGKDRKIDILVLHEPTGEGLAIECKYQNSQGTADEKIPYALDDLRAMRMAGSLVYAGDGFSRGILHLLRASDMSAYCLPAKPDFRRTAETWELDHVLAMKFKWWDVIADEARRFKRPSSLT